MQSYIDPFAPPKKRGKKPGSGYAAMLIKDFLASGWQVRLVPPISGRKPESVYSSLHIAILRNFPGQLFLAQRDGRAYLVRIDEEGVSEG